MSVLSYEDHIKLAKGKPHKLSPLNEFFNVMSSTTRTRFGMQVSNFSNQCILYLFNMDKLLLLQVYKELPIWPTRIIIDYHMPCIFLDLYPSTRCIIDATEIFIQNPSAQQLTFSNYKNRNTFKALIAISPSGAIRKLRFRFMYLGVTYLIKN